MKLAAGILIAAFLALTSCSSNPPVPEAYEMEQTKRYEFERRQLDSTWR